MKKIYFLLFFFLLVGCMASTRYEVLFNLDGGTLDHTYYSYAAPTLIELKTPTKDGFSFLGWYIDGEKVLDNTYYIDKNTTFNAMWEQNEYKIKYDDEEITIKYGEKINLPQKQKDGHTFLGWYMGGELFDEEYFNFTNDLILTSKFAKNNYLLTLDDEVINVEYGEKINLPQKQKVGHTFLGWYMGSELFNEEYFNFTNDLSLTSKFVKNKYLLTLDDEVLNVEYGEEINLPQKQKDGYTFLGWYKDDELFDHFIYNFTFDLVLEARFSKNVTLELIDSFDVRLYNTQTSDYDEISLFARGEKISASKYWHKIGINKQDDSYYVDTIVTSGNSVTSILSDYILLAYSSYPKYASFASLNVEKGDVVIFSEDISTLQKGEISLNVSFYKEKVELGDISSIKEEFLQMYQDLNVVTSDINLIETYKKHNVIWESSNIDALSSSGVYMMPYVSRFVILSAYINSNKVFEKEVYVKGKTDESSALKTGYFYTNFSKISEYTIQNLDIMYVSFAYINELGEFTNMHENSTFMKNVKTYVMPLAKKYNTKVVVSVNEQNDAFGIVVKDDVKRKKLTEEIIKIVKLYGFDGVDIDWEVPKDDETPYFTMFIKELHLALKKENPSLILSAAIAGGKWQPPKYDLSNSSKYLDYINLMTYSMTKSNGQFHNALYKSSKGYTLTSCSIAESIAIYDSYGVERSKILVGLAFYGIKQKGLTKPGQTSSSSASISFNEIYQTYLNSHNENVSICYDLESCSAYIIDLENEFFISYESEESIRRKCEYVNTLGLAGVMYWQDGHDYNDVLVTSIIENINK